MVTGIDIKLEPVAGSLSGEMFKFRLKHGTSFVFDIEHYTVITTKDENGVATSDYFPIYGDKIMNIIEAGEGFMELLLKVPVNNIRYIQCYYE